MLIPDFYNILNFEATNDRVIARIALNKSHKIYGGHFPGQPVVPGVVQLQMVKEMMEKATGKSLFLVEIASAKYLNMINPMQSEKIDIEINFQANSVDQYKVDARILNDDLVFLKLKAHVVQKNPV